MSAKVTGNLTLNGQVEQTYGGQPSNYSPSLSLPISYDMPSGQIARVKGTANDTYTNTTGTISNYASGAIPLPFNNTPSGNACFFILINLSSTDDLVLSGPAGVTGSSQLNFGSGWTNHTLKPGHAVVVIGSVANPFTVGIVQLRTSGPGVSYDLQVGFV